MDNFVTYYLLGVKNNQLTLSIIGIINIFANK